MRFAHLSDTHIGIRQYNLDEREEDFYAAFDEVVDKIIESGCDFVVHSGDLFDEPRPQVKAMVRARDAIDRLLEADIPIFAIPGNHDLLMRKGAVPPHAIYRKLELLTLKNPTREFEGLLLCGLPYHSKVHINALKDKLGELVKEAKEYENSILVLHQGIDKYFGLEYELKISDIPAGFDYYALGHIHKRIEDDFDGGKLVYPGSTEMWRSDEVSDYEENGKGFVIVDTSDFTHTRVNLEGTRRFLNVKIDSLSNFDFNALKDVVGSSMPVLNVKIKADMEYSDIHSRLKGIEKDVLRLNISKKTGEIGEETFSSRLVNVQEIIEDLMKDHTDEERQLAIQLFELLKKRRVEAAQGLIDDFFETWSSRSKSGNESTIQSSLEASR